MSWHIGTPCQNTIGKSALLKAFSIVLSPAWYFLKRSSKFLFSLNLKWHRSGYSWNFSKMSFVKFCTYDVSAHPAFPLTFLHQLPLTRSSPISRILSNPIEFIRYMTTELNACGTNRKGANIPRQGVRCHSSLPCRSTSWTRKFRTQPTFMQNRTFSWIIAGLISCLGRYVSG